MGFVTVCHPHHPLRGQQLPVISIRHGEHPDVIVRLPDGNHAAIALDATDLAEKPSSPSSPPGHASHMLDIDGLRRMVQLLDAIRRRGSPLNPSS
ncbi:MAG: Y4bD/Y4pK family protein [Planctomycetes bacterium]|nr:Y4bD/Y4pK family protein [Planctomycetota bacterium]